MRTLIYLLPLLFTFSSCNTSSPNTQAPEFIQLEDAIHIAQSDDTNTLSWKYSSCKKQNSRQYMEDRHVIKTIRNYMIAAVFDGHGGDKTADWLSKNLPEKLAEVLDKKGHQATFEQHKEAIIGFFKKLDERIFHAQKTSFWSERREESGSTAIVYLAIKYPNEAKREILINLGDSRAIVVKGQKIDTETIDHKPDHQKEKQRITRNGGRIYLGNQVLSYDGKYILAMSRSFGDFSHKFKNDEYSAEVVSAQPDIYEISTEPGDYVVLASDGLYDGIKTKQIAQYLALERFQNISKVLAQKAIKNRSRDNITVIVLQRVQDKEGPDIHTID